MFFAYIFSAILLREVRSLQNIHIITIPTGYTGNSCHLFIAFHVSVVQHSSNGRWNKFQGDFSWKEIPNSFNSAKVWKDIIIFLLAITSRVKKFLRGAHCLNYDSSRISKLTERVFDVCNFLIQKNFENSMTKLFIIYFLDWNYWKDKKCI